MKNKKLKEFGAGSSTIEWGYNFELLVGHIESLIQSEEENVYDNNKSTKRQKERLDKAQDALQLLQEVLNY